MEFWIPYGRTEVPVRVPDQNFQGIIESTEKKDASPSISSLMESALDHPLDGFSLGSLVKPGSKVGILVDPMIPEVTLGAAIESIRNRLSPLGVQEVKIYARIRSTCPRTSFRTINPAVGSFMEVGKTSRGTKVSVDQDFLQCDLKILVGIVRPHFASVFTGGPDLIVPGVASIETITANRSLFMAAPAKDVDPFNYTENAVFADSLEASKMVGGTYLLTMIPDEWGGIFSVHSGEIESTFKESVSDYQRTHFKPLDNRPEIIVVSPDRLSSGDLYHAVRILPFLWNIMRRDGSTVVMAAECQNGVGDTGFMAMSKQHETRKDMQTDLKRKFRMGGHVAILLKEALERSRLQLASVMPDAYTRSFGMKPSRTVTAGVQSAIRAEGKDAKVLIITSGSLTVPVLNPPIASISDHA